MSESLKGNRFLAITSIIRLNQIEVAHDRFIGNDEKDMVSLENARRFRETIRSAYPDGAITWALSYGALTSELEQFRQLREYVRKCHSDFGDDVTYIVGGFFANAYSTTDRVNAELDEALGLVYELMGPGYRPQSVIAGFLSSANQRHLADKHGIHVCQGTIWSQYSIDNQDGDGSVCYPYYPSTEHFCKPAQGADDFIDCVCLDGWSCDFVCARENGADWECNSRMGVGPIETIMTYGDDVGVAEQLATTACHFDGGFARNGFAYVPVIWELSLMDMHDRDCTALADWLGRVARRWPDSRMCTMGDIGLRWRAENPDNSRFDYRFEMGGSGIGGSHRWLRVKWYMNSLFRLSLIKDLRDGSVHVTDFTVYSDPAREPESGTTRSWSLMGRINQKGVRPQDRPVRVSELDDAARALIASRGIDVNELERFEA
jgi:hypothetical protein